MPVGPRELTSWISWQLAKWDAWAGARDSAWLSLPTGNPAHPTMAQLFAHAFGPLYRYGDQVLGVEPVNPYTGLESGWPELHSLAKRCLAHFMETAATVSDPERPMTFHTRSLGSFEITVAQGLTHALMHCYWHLGGLAHLLRAAGIEPPQRGDMIFWAAEHNAPREKPPEQG